MVSKKKSSRKTSKKKSKKLSSKDFPTLILKHEEDIAMDFAIKLYKKFDKIIKSVVLFGSTAKKTQTAGSDIDIIIILDDATIEWNQENILWYRKELELLIKENPYNFHLHINTIKLSTWWADLMRGDPVILNILRYGKSMVDLAGFFDPQKKLLLEGKIRPSPEAIYNLLQRAPEHLTRSKMASLSAMEGIFWSMVDSSHAALITIGRMPPSPEHIAGELLEAFVSKNLLDSKYIKWYNEILSMHKEVSHGRTRELKGVEMDLLRDKAEEFLNIMTKLINKIIDKRF